MANREDPSLLLSSVKLYKTRLKLPADENAIRTQFIVSVDVSGIVLLTYVWRCRR